MVFEGGTRNYGVAHTVTAPAWCDTKIKKARQTEEQLAEWYLGVRVKEE